MARLLSDEERVELRQIVEEALAHSLPKWAAKISAEVRTDLKSQFELMGLAAEDFEDRAEIRKDMEFIRIARTIFVVTATKLGGVILTAFFFGMMALAGYGAWLKNWFTKFTAP